MPFPPLDAAGAAAYTARLNSPHDFNIEVDVLDMDEHLIGQLQFLDGQVNFQKQARDSTNGIARTANLVVLDPADLLQVSLLQGQAFGNKLVRVRHTVDVAGVGEVSVEAGTFTISQPQGDSYELTLELQDLSSLAVRGTKPYAVKKGKNAVDAWVAIMRDTVGARKFRVPTGIKTTLPDPLNVGWSDDASPWAVGQKIADLLDMEQLVSHDAYWTLRTPPKTPVWTFDTSVNVTDLPSGGYDWTDAVNYARVGGGKKGATPGVAEAPNAHPNSKETLAFHGVDRYLPFISDKTFGRFSERQASAVRVLARELSMNTDMSWPVIPVFHLDPGDPVRLVSPFGSTVVPLDQASIPLAVGGDMTVGAIRPVSGGYTRNA